MTPALTRAQAEEAAGRLRLFAQPQRLMILATLLDGERSVSEIEAASGIRQPALSQQLADLRHGEAVSARRQSRQVFYSLAGADIDHCVRSLCALFGGDGRTGKPAPAPLSGAGAPSDTRRGRIGPRELTC